LRANSKVVENTGVTFIEDVNGELQRTELPLSQNEAYKKWMELQDPKLASTFDAMGWDEQTKSELEKFIDPEVKEWAKWQIEEFYPAFHEKINEAYRELYYTNLPFNPFYNPIKREVTTVGDKEDSLLNPNQLISSVGNTSLKSRVTNKNQLQYTDGDQVLARHISEMEHFIAWGEAIRELRATFGSRQVQDAIKKIYGNSIRSAINSRINSLARGGADRANVNQLLNKIRRNFVTSVLGLNITMLPKQIVSTVAYLNELGPTDFANGMIELGKNPAKAIQIMNQSELIKARYKKGWTHEMEVALKNTTPNIVSGMNSDMNRLRNALIILLRLGDRAGIYGGYGVYVKHYNEFTKQNPTATTEQANEFALNEFEKIAGRTQQSAAVKDTGALQEGSVGGLFTMFHNSQQQYFRYEMAAIHNLIKKRGNIPENIKIIAVTHFLLPVLFQMVANAFLDADDDVKKKRLLRAAILGSFNGLLIAGDIVEYGLEKIQGEWWEYSASPIFDTVQDLGYGLAEIAKAIKESSPEDLIKGADALIKFSSETITGLPYEGGKKIISQITGKKQREDAIDKTNGRLNKYQKEKEKDPKLAELARLLSYRYSAAKSLATKYEKAGFPEPAEKIREIVKDSKFNLSETDYAYDDVLNEYRNFAQLYEGMK